MSLSRSRLLSVAPMCSFLGRGYNCPIRLATFVLATKPTDVPPISQPYVAETGIPDKRPLQSPLDLRQRTPDRTCFPVPSAATCIAMTRPIATLTLRIAISNLLAGAIHQCFIAFAAFKTSPAFADVTSDTHCRRRCPCWIRRHGSQFRNGQYMPRWLWQQYNFPINLETHRLRRVTNVFPLILRS